MMADRDAQDADGTYTSLVQSGYDEEVASIVRDQLRVRQLETYATEIEQLLKAKASLVAAKAGELFSVLSGWVGLRHVFPTSQRIEHRGTADSVDLAVTVPRSERGNQVQFVWKTHNLHVVDTLPEGFALGSLNMGRRDEKNVETQIPILAMLIRPAGADGRKLFSGERGSNEAGGSAELEVTFRVNRSWIEEKSTASDSELDSAFGSAYAFLDFLSDHAENPVYARMMTLISGVNEILSNYLDSKKRFIERLEL
jgi:hypothetical protein